MMNILQTQETKNRSPITEIYVVGPSSTGKTTLCRAVAAGLGLNGPEFITEVAREVMEREGYTRYDVGKLEMQATIMRAQLLREQKGRIAASRAGSILLSDRSAIDAIAYAVLTSASEEEAQRRMQNLTQSGDFQLALSRYRESQFVLLGPVPEWWEDDGIRSEDNQVSYC
jgi:nicotinamide riboside kinase